MDNDSTRTQTMCAAEEAYERINEALNQLRTAYGRLPELDVIEIGAAAIEGARRTYEGTLRAVRAVVADGLTG